MKYRFALFLSVSVLVVYCCLDHTAVPTGFALSPQVAMELNSPCLSDGEILRRLEALSTGQTFSEQQSAQNQLVADAKKSPECRKRIITALVKAMDKPTSELQNDRPNFYLWYYGAEIFASLKAEEALDLLIGHFDLNDGTPFPLNHHPALVNIIRMGSIALPKLKVLLLQSPHPNARQYAVFCIASIGGSDGEKVLQQALTSESNKCVNSFIRASLQAFKNSSSRHQIAPESQTEWYAAFLCDSSR